MKRLKNLCLLTLAILLVSFGAAGMVTFAASDTSSSSTQNGLVEENGKLYYYKNGKLVTDKLGIKIGKSYYKISKKGVCKKVSEAAGRAGVQLEKIGRASSNSKTLKKAFKWCSTKITYKTNCGSPSSGQSDAAYYSIYGFKNKKGDCVVMAATFYQMAKVLGYNAKLVRGYIVSGYNSDGSPILASHAWVTIKISGTTYVYDPNFAYVQHTLSNNTSAHSGYKMTYTKTGSKKQYVYYSSKKKLLK
ncbi:MAG: transglutaminase-like domain-containing protein [Lachnospiraceae bacterium]|nr:transglutaminase-like domain-containing protein [Lachnospiraceae bacterium]